MCSKFEEFTARFLLFPGWSQVLCNNHLFKSASTNGHLLGWHWCNAEKSRSCWKRQSSTFDRNLSTGCGEKAVAVLASGFHTYRLFVPGCEAQLQISFLWSYDDEPYNSYRRCSSCIAHSEAVVLNIPNFKVFSILEIRRTTGWQQRST